MKSGAVENDPRWMAVQARDARADGQFIFAVRSTGIYCRPSCPSRRPKPAQVKFFLAPAAAEAAGFRPCKRCHPKEPDPNSHAEIVQRICRTLDVNVEAPITLKDLSRDLGISPHHLQRIFKRAMGISPRAYADARRLNHFKSSLKKGQPVADALYGAGYGSSSRLYEKASSHLGMTPATYRRGGLGMSIGYTTVNSPLGRLLVAATHRGICAVYLGDSDAKLEAALEREYPSAEIQQDKNGFRPWVQSLLKHLQGQKPQLRLPLDVQATAFQRRVWEELKKIPYGSTRSYSDIARALGRPTAQRAVARACATNPVSIVIPCHRVLREDGNLGGYRWGLDRKRALLQQEHRVRHPTPQKKPS